MEIAPLELFGGYDKVPGKYKPYDLAKIITAMIMKKAVRYSGSIGRELHLLTYITHWGFTPSESLINLVRVFLDREKHPFVGVYLYSPFEPGAGSGRVLTLSTRSYARDLIPTGRLSRSVEHRNLHCGTLMPFRKEATIPLL